MEEFIHQLFPEFESDLVKDITEHAQIKEIRAGEQLMKTGQYFRSTMLVIKGLVKVYREDEEGNEYFIYYLQPGQACALSMICAIRQQASQLMGKAVTDTTILAIPLEYMDKWITKYKSWYYYVLGSYRSRFEDLLSTIDHIAFRNMDERLLFYLKRQQRTLNTNILAISNTEIAQELNSSREVISRLMKKLAENGNIRLLKGQQIEIVSLDMD
ncbi:MAG: Crp/Fnr family transcriptional regulator [Bacteroidota bacterium]|nr:Crp/Fnr family transcriptional regulator [Bacteroidota bacterium]MDP4212782.1 Crp/Fnr family transcriptional regulator [Bacteroidota bacterium]MDP4250874.1 Crp/Fnr family transcriptional regulator [Bacteroidota bacterium]